MQKIKIISGGQTGVDRAALDFALKHLIPCGGYCPKFRRAEDGVIPLHYPLTEMNAVGYSVRTRKNISASDGTLILYFEKADQGTLLTIKLCKTLSKPYLIQKSNIQTNADKVKFWLESNKIKVLNIAGCRESFAPGIHDATIKFLEYLFSRPD